MFRLDNTAEQLFKEMEEKDGATYEALIQGLVKVSPFFSSWDILFVVRRTRTFGELLKSLMR